MHIYFNGLQEAVEGQGEWEELSAPLNDLSLFLRNKDLRGRFLATCVPPNTMEWAIIDAWTALSDSGWGGLGLSHRSGAYSPRGSGR